MRERGQGYYFYSHASGLVSSIGTVWARPSCGTGGIGGIGRPSVLGEGHWMMTTLKGPKRPSQMHGVNTP